MSKLKWTKLPRKTSAPETMGVAGLIVVLLVAFVGQVDMFIVNVAAPGIERGLNSTFEELQFVVNAYVIVYAAGLVLGGRIGGRIGHRTAFDIGVASFGVASLLCAVAPSAPLLIVARALQGMAAALMMPQVLSMIHAHYRGASRARAVGAYGAAIGLGVIAGLIGGGVLMAADIGGLGWRTVFLVNLPICLAVLIGSRAWVPQSGDDTHHRIDYVGALLLLGLLPALLVPLAVGSSLGWPWWAAALIVAAVLLLVILIAHQRLLERRGMEPIVPLRLFARRGFGLCMALVCVFFAGNAGLFLVLTYHLQSGLGLGPLPTGFVFVPLGLGFAVSSILSKGLAERYGSRVAVGGAVLMSCSLLAVPVVTSEPAAVQSWLLAAILGVSGVGQGLVVARLVDTVLELVPTAESGSGSGMFNTMTQAGMAIGIALLGALYQNALGANPETADGLSFTDFEHAFDFSAYVLAGLALLTAAMIAVVARVSRRSEACRESSHGNAELSFADMTDSS